MFDIGFTELLLISIVALLVLGPEKLPQAVRTAALWIGRARRSFNKVKADIEREINADDIRRQLHNESILADLDEAKEKAGQLTRDTKESFSSLERDVRRGLEEGAGSADESGRNAEPRTEEDKSEAASEPTVEAPEKPADDEDGNAAATGDDNRPVTDFYNNPPEKVVVQGRKFRAGKDDDDNA